MWRSTRFAVWFALLAPLLIAVPRALAQDDQQCFDETGFCVGGRFLTYWRQNGGLDVFGFPLGPAAEITNADGDQVLAQLFERQRFELHPENPAPYDVLFGRLGALDVLHIQPIDPERQREDGPRAGCVWFAATGFNVCDEQGFASYWQHNGLRDPALDRAAQSLALFGYPLTRLIAVAGQAYTHVQYFERARFEYHPTNPAPFTVLLGRLGAERLNDAPGAPGIGRVVYAKNDGLYTMLVDGSRQTRILSPDVLGVAPSMLFDPRWSPDARTIAFGVGVPDGQTSSLYVVNADGSAPTRIAQASYGPDWSPDGTRLVYTRSTVAPPSAGSQIVRAAADGSQASVLTGDDVYAFGAQWSPDGTRIAYHAAPRAAQPSVPQLFIMNADGSGQTQRSRDGAGNFDWSPDGTRIVFDLRSTGAASSELMVVSVDTGTVVQITDSPALESEPRWSPDGALIAFVRLSGQGQDTDMYTIAADGSDERAFVAGPEAAGSPVWVTGGSVPSVLYTAFDAQGLSIFRAVRDSATKLSDGYDPDVVAR